ncbi:hypothetical protein JW933_11085 [candidate division FCPU426 bacterium]|nr:hypothetical protein [candidate division FCPU426 bacterium]
MELDTHLSDKDWIAVLWIGITQAAAAWLMSLLDVVYAPIPMFAAAVVGGFLFKGHPKQASLGGAMAGLLGGGLAEWAFHTVRIQNRLLNWSQMAANEQFGLAVAEMIFYAALLSFFTAFFSWGTHKEEPSVQPEAAFSVRPTEPMYSPAESDEPAVNIPLIKEDADKNSS